MPLADQTMTLPSAIVWWMVVGLIVEFLFIAIMVIVLLVMFDERIGPKR